MTLVEFYLARLDELTRRALSLHDLDSDCEIVLTASESGPCTCGVPNLVLADIAAKRAILAEYEGWVQVSAHSHNPIRQGQAEIAMGVLATAIAQLATVYADREGWQEEWRP